MDRSPNPSQAEDMEFSLWYAQIVFGPGRGAALRAVGVNGDVTLAIWGAFHLGAVAWLAVEQERETRRIRSRLHKTSYPAWRRSF